MASRFPGSLLCLLLAACDASITVPGDNRSRTVDAVVGETLRIVLGNVGPGTFEAPPLVSSPAIAYVDVTIIPPFTPAGPTQEFRFTAVRRGTAIVHFRRLLYDGAVVVVEDTINVH